MGKFFNKAKNKVKNVDDAMENAEAREGSKNPNKRKFKERINDGLNAADDDYWDNENKDSWGEEWGGEVNIQQAQKSESFHHFILENQYKDLERSIRGLKDVWDKVEQKWRTIRKKIHCFTDEEAEDVLRTAQSHLATDIKLGLIRKDTFGLHMDAIYKEIAFLFESIAEYRYGRYGDEDKQYQMKLQNQKIFLELWSRVQANYSRSIEGHENKATHGSVSGQESLQHGDNDGFERDRRMYGR